MATITTLTEEERRALIAKFNDELRQTGEGGRIVMTSGVSAMGPDFRRRGHGGGALVLDL